MMEDQSSLPRCGDRVRHHPSGKEFLVAWAEGDELAPAIWFNRTARLSDCEVTKRCTDAEHAESVNFWNDMRDHHRSRVLQLYPEVPLSTTLHFTIVHGSADIGLLLNQAARARGIEVDVQYTRDGAVCLTSSAGRVLMSDLIQAALARYPNGKFY